MEISLSFWARRLGAFRSSNSFISPPKTDLSEHYVKVLAGAFFLVLFLYFGQPRPVVAAVFFFPLALLGRKGLNLNGLQIYAVSTEKRFQFRTKTFDDEFVHESFEQTFPRGGGVGK